MIPCEFPDTLNYFLEKEQDLDKVLNIFIRLNSGGTVLSYSDLLLSVAAAQWEHLDAREAVTEFVDELNKTGNGFNFDKDFVLKSCLVLGDFPNIAFKVDNFNKRNMLSIEERWDEITDALRSAVTLVNGFGYSRDTLTANNAVIPIAYYLLKRGLPRNYDQAIRYRDDRERVRLWIILSLVKRVFGGVPDTVLRPIQTILCETDGEFPVEQIKRHFKGTTKSLQVTLDDIENMLFYRYGQGYTFSTLALLYPTLDYRNEFHQDHIFPKSKFTRTKLVKSGIPAHEIDFYLDSVDTLPNLQLLEGIPNQEKSASEFKDWLDKTCPSKDARRDYMAKHYIPNIDLSLANFREFIEKRRALLHEKFGNILEASLEPN